MHSPAHPATVAKILLVVVGLRLAIPDRCAAEDWVEVRVVGPFLCRSEFPLSGAGNLVSELGHLQDDLVRSLRIRPAAESIEIYLFADARSYRRFLSRYFPEVPDRRALYLKSDGSGMVLAYRSGQFDVDLRHECTHALIHAVLPMVPLWLDEGLAEYFEVTPAKRMYNSPHAFATRWNARLGIVPLLLQVA